MLCYSIEPRDQIFVKGYEFLPLGRNVGKKLVKNISKNLSQKYSQKVLDHADKSATDKIKTASKKAIQKKEKAMGDLIESKIEYKLTKSQKSHHKITFKVKQE